MTHQKGFEPSTMITPNTVMIISLLENAIWSCSYRNSI